MKKLIVTLTAVAFTAVSLGFMGCSSEIAEDPNAVKANDETSQDENPEMKTEKGGEAGGTLKLKGKKPGGGGNLDD